MAIQKKWKKLAKSTILQKTTDRKIKEKNKKRQELMALLIGKSNDTLSKSQSHMISSTLIELRISDTEFGHLHFSHVSQHRNPALLTKKIVFSVLQLIYPFLDTFLLVWICNQVTYKTGKLNPSNQYDSIESIYLAWYIDDKIGYFH